MSGPRIVVISGRRHPHEVCLLAFATLIGVAYLAGAPRGSSLADLRPWVVTVWAVMLVLGGVPGLISHLPALRARHFLRALSAEQAAMLIHSGAAVFYLSALITLGPRALTAGGLVAAWGASNLWRAVQLSREIREVPG